VAEGVDPALDADEALGAQAVIDRVLTESQPQELAPGHEPVLSSGQPADRFFDGIQPVHMAG
jgi:hypothetical protein